MASNTTFFRDMQIRKMTLGDIFSDVFTKHSSRDISQVFISGTELTTPREQDMLSTWRKPFLFAYFFIFTLLIAVMCYALGTLNNSGYFYMMLIVSALTPLTMLLLVWEMNIPRNISLMNVLGFLFIGGIVSLAITMVLKPLHPSGHAMWAPVSEEPAKFLIAYFFIKRKDYKFNINGILVGAAVGAGFAVFENITYTVNTFIGSGLSFSQGINTSYVRAVTGLGTHVVYTALVCGGYMMAKGNEPHALSHVFKGPFLKYFGLAFALHMLNNSGLLPNSIYLHTAVTVTLGVAAILPLLRNAVNELVLYVMSINGSMGDAHYPQPYDHRAPSANSLEISFVAGPYTGRSFRAGTARPLSIGRIEGRCDLAIPNCYNVSGCHCSVQVANGIICIMDLNSSNGTFVEGSRLVPMRPRQVHSGAIVYLGGADCAFQVRIT